MRRVSTNRILHRQLYDSHIKLHNFTARWRLPHTTLSGNQGSWVALVFFLKQMAWRTNPSRKPVRVHTTTLPRNKTKKPKAQQQKQEGQLCPHISSGFWFVRCFSPSPSQAVSDTCLYCNRIIDYSTYNLHGKKSNFALDLSHCIKLPYSCLGWEGCQQAQRTLFCHLQSRKIFQGLLLLFCTQQTIALMIFALFIMQLNGRIHFHHVFSWHSLNV